MRISTASIITAFAALLAVAGCSNDDNSEEQNQNKADTTVKRDTDDNGGMDVVEDTGDESMDVADDTGDEPMDVVEDTGDEPMDAGTDTGEDEMDAGRDVASDTDEQIDSHVDPSDTGGDVAPDSTEMADTQTDTQVDTAPTPDGGTSEQSIYDIRSAAQGLTPGGALSGTYTTEGVVVTGVQTDGSGNVQGVFVQEPSGPPEDSGIWVFFGNAQSGVSVPSLSRGNVISVTGTVTNYDNNGGSTSGGLLEIHEVSSVTVTQQNGTVPSPVQISSPSMLAPGGSNAETYESVLVEVSNVSVDTSPNQYGETLLDSGVRIGNTLYDYTQDFSPSSGTTYSSVVGPLNYGFDKTKIVPREQSDITP